MKDTDIRNLLDDYEVQPSPRCWQTIEQQLVAPKTMPKVSHAVQGASHVSKAMLLAVAGVVASAAIGVGTWLYVTHSVAPQSPQTQVLPIVVDTVARDSVMADTVLNPSAVSGNFHTQVVRKPNVEPPFAPCDETTSVPQAASVIASIVPATKPDFPTTVLPVSHSSVSSQIIEKQDVVEKPRTEEQTGSHPSKLDQTDDPVLQNWNGSEESEAAEPVVLSIPNVITPNGDGYNDFFVITGIEHCENSKLIIRNSMRSVVFQSTNYQNNWGASGLSGGTYTYQFYYTIRGIQQMRAGTLTVLK